MSDEFELDNLKDALQDWRERRAPKDVVPYGSDDRPLPVGAGELVSYIDLDAEGIPRQYTDTAFVSPPFTKESDD